MNTLPNKVRILLLIIVSLALHGCSGEMCIDADDFGFAKVTISSRQDPETLYSLSQGHQVAPWLNSQYRVNGRPLTILVKTWQYGVEWNTRQELSAWCPWYGAQGDDNQLSSFCEKLTDCQFVNNKMCASTIDAPIINAPCLMKNGVGLYALIAEADTDPNASYTSEQNPSGVTLHLGEPRTDYDMYDINKRGEQRIAGGLVYNYEGNKLKKQQYADAPLYFKILDKFYDDNSGQYKVVIKSGITDTRPDPVQFLTKLVKDNLFGVGNDYGLIRKIYLNIIKNPGYQIAVKGMLSLYIIFTALSYLVGNINLTNIELIKRVVKVSIIAALLSSNYAWSFFNDYLFVWFVGGVEQVIQMIMEAGSTGPGSTSILGLMIAPETISKVMSLLLIDWRGFIYIILYLIALYFILMLIFQASILYLSALIIIGMLIIMGPIFLCFMLFGITRSLFENWLRQLIGYAIQPLIIFTGIVFISMIIRSEIYSTLGFRVCKKEFPNLGSIGDILGNISDKLDLGIDLTHSIFYWGFPNPGKGKFTQTKAKIPVPHDFEKSDGTFCSPYECIDERYIELPFLDPKKDAQRIQNFFNGNFLQFDGLLLIIISLYLLSKFNNFSVSIAGFLSSTSGNLTDLHTSSNEAFAPIKQRMDKALSAPAKFVDQKLGIRRNLHTLKELASYGAASVYEKGMEKWLKHDAFNNPNSSVLDEVKRSYGLNHKDLKQNAKKSYQNAIAASLRSNLDASSMTDAELKDKTKSLSKKKLNKDSVSEVLYQGKKYSDLSDDQKLKVDNVLKHKQEGKSLRELYSDAKFAEQFESAYVNSHYALSARGIGFFGKRFESFRTLQEINRSMELDKQMKAHKKAYLGERIYSGYEGLKHGVAKATMGEDFANRTAGAFTGAAWNDYQYDDPRLRTYSEVVAEKDRMFKADQLKEEINHRRQESGEDILSYEYQMRPSATAKDIDLMKQQVEQDVYEACVSGPNPVLMGDKFMKEKATDSQMRDMIDRAYQVRDQIKRDNWYISQEERYELTRDIADEKIETMRVELGHQLNRSDIKLEEIPELLRTMHREKDIKDFYDNLNSLEYSKKALQKVDEHRAMIDTEIEKYVQRINRYASLK